ncbi:peptidylprolyl isomerase [Clostridium sp. C2-6-12]|uniref:peptidylprolyl isomerase n=1 Tax=Clostridium sp. C2-6-12 TaxID=2698832 RepID=UPI002433D845|nr:peptidylprolyl isomerase [Clostridium sp. C2-6-12]
MAHDAEIDGYKLGSDGAWIQNAILATVGNENIMEDDLNKAMKNYDAKLKQQYGADYANNSNLKAAIKNLKKQELDKLIAEKILLKKAVELNLKPTDIDISKKVEEEANKFKTKYSGLGQYENILKQNGINETEFKEVIKNSVIVKAVEEDILKNVTITDEEAKSYYDKNKENIFTKGAGANVAHILVTDEQKAKELKAKLDAGADFGTLAKENSIDNGSKNNGGSLGFVQYNTEELVREFVDGFKNLKEGQVSEPVKSQFGYHLIKVTGIKSGEVIPFDEAKEQLKNFLLEQKKDAVYDSKIKEWKTALGVKTYEDKL